MHLQIVYECPHCNQPLPRSLAELRPGQNRDCLGCGAPVALTRKSLDTLRRDLHDAFRLDSSAH